MQPLDDDDEDQDADDRDLDPATAAPPCVTLLPVDEFMGIAADSPRTVKRRCGRHMTDAIETQYGGFFAAHVAYRGVARADVGTGTGGELRLVQVLPGDARMPTPPGHLCVVYRQFACARHRHYMDERARAVRLQCVEWAQTLVLGCRDCCLCPALQLFELMPPKITMARMTPAQAIADARRLGDVGAECIAGCDADLIMSPQFGAQPLATQRAALLWFFGDVYEPTRAFWRCAQDALDHHGVAGVPTSIHGAVCKVQDEALRMWMLITMANDDWTIAHYQSLRDTLGCRMLQAGRLYVHGKHMRHDHSS
jgi:hypothetical protein